MKFPRLARISIISTVFVAMTTQAFAFSAQSTTSLNVRSGPGTGYGVVDTLYDGEKVNVTECRNSGWCHITHSGPDGWVSARYLNQTGAPRTSGTSDAAAFAMFSTLLGLSVMAMSNGSRQQPRNPPPLNPPRNPPQIQCLPGQVWHPGQGSCVVGMPHRP